MFVEDAELIEIKIYYRKSTSGRKYDYDAYTAKELDELRENLFGVDKDGEDKTEDAEKKSQEFLDSFKTLNVKMKELTWGLHNQIQESGIIEDATGERTWNYGLFKESRLVSLIDSWDAVDKDGKPVSVSANTIRKLAPDIGEAITRAYDEESYVTEEQEGN